MNPYIVLDDYQYAVIEVARDSYQRIFDRQRIHEVGLDGRSIIDDYTNSNREPHNWQMTLEAYIADRPSASWGMWTDLLASYRKAYVTMVYFDGSTEWDVGIQAQLIPLPRVGANIEGHCLGVYWINVDITEVYT